MNQKLSWTLFVAGLCACFISIGHDLQSHTDWSSIATPQSVGEMLAEIGGVGVTVVGALGVALPKKE